MNATLNPIASEWEIEPAPPDASEFCPACDHLDCTCPPEDGIESTCQWYDQLARNHDCAQLDREIAEREQLEYEAAQSRGETGGL